MAQEPTREARILVVVNPDERATSTVEHGVRQARDAQAESGTTARLDVRIVERPGAAASRTKARVEKALAASGDGDAVHTSVELLRVDGDDPKRRTASLLEAIDAEAVSLLVLSADGNDLSVELLRERLGVTRVELAPSDGTRERRQLVVPGGVRRLATIFGLTYLFYLAVGGFAGGLDLLTGAVSAAVVSVALANVTFREEPELKRTGVRLARMVLFLPVLLWEIVKANVSIAVVVLHPRLPIDPSMGILETDTSEGLERMVLANSITLTPGTLTVDVQDRAFTIHSLTAGARSDLEGGRLPRLVAWVFHGRNRDEPDAGEAER